MGILGRKSALILTVTVTCTIAAVASMPWPESIDTEEKIMVELDLSLLLSQKFANCSAECRKDSGCIGFTIFQAHENSTVNTVSDIFWCRLDLESREEDLTRGSIVYQAMQRDKLVKVQPRPLKRPKRATTSSRKTPTLGAKKIVIRQEDASASVTPAESTLIPETHFSISSSPQAGVQVSSLSSQPQQVFDTAVPRPVNVTIRNSTVISGDPNQTQVQPGNVQASNSTPSLLPDASKVPPETVQVPIIELELTEAPGQLEFTQVTTQKKVITVTEGAKQNVLEKEVPARNPAFPLTNSQTQLSAPTPGSSKTTLETPVPGMIPSGPMTTEKKIPPLTPGVPSVTSVTQVPALTPAAPQNTSDTQVPALTLGAPQNTSDTQVPALTPAAPQKTSDTQVPALTPGTPQNTSDTHIPALTPAAPQNTSDTQVPALDPGTPQNTSDTQVPALTPAAPQNTSDTPVSALTLSAPQNTSDTQVPALTPGAPQNTSDTQVPAMTPGTPQTASDTQVPAPGAQKTTLETPVPTLTLGAANTTLETEVPAITTGIPQTSSDTQVPALTPGASKTTLETPIPTSSSGAPISSAQTLTPPVNTTSNTNVTKPELTSSLSRPVQESLPLSPTNISLSVPSAAPPQSGIDRVTAMTFSTARPPQPLLNNSLPVGPNITEPPPNLLGQSLETRIHLPEISQSQGLTSSSPTASALQESKVTNPSLKPAPESMGTDETTTFTSVPVHVEGSTNTSGSTFETQLVLPQNLSAVLVNLPALTLDLGRVGSAEINVTTIANIKTTSSENSPENKQPIEGHLMSSKMGVGGIKISGGPRIETPSTTKEIPTTTIQPETTTSLLETTNPSSETTTVPPETTTIQETERTTQSFVTTTALPESTTEPFVATTNLPDIETQALLAKTELPESTTEAIRTTTGVPEAFTTTTISPEAFKTTTALPEELTTTTTHPETATESLDTTTALPEFGFPGLEGKTSIGETELLGVTTVQPEFKTEAFESTTESVERTTQLVDTMTTEAIGTTVEPTEAGISTSPGENTTHFFEINIPGVNASQVNIQPIIIVEVIKDTEGNTEGGNHSHSMSAHNIQSQIKNVTKLLNTTVNTVSSVLSEISKEFPSGETPATPGNPPLVLEGEKFNSVESTEIPGASETSTIVPILQTTGSATKASQNAITGPALSQEDAEIPLGNKNSPTKTPVAANETDVLPEGSIRTSLKSHNSENPLPGHFTNITSSHPLGSSQVTSETQTTGTSGSPALTPESMGSTAEVQDTSTKILGVRLDALDVTPSKKIFESSRPKVADVFHPGNITTDTLNRISGTLPQSPFPTGLPSGKQNSSFDSQQQETVATSKESANFIMPQPQISNKVGPFIMRPVTEIIQLTKVPVATTELSGIGEAVETKAEHRLHPEVISSIIAPISTPMPVVFNLSSAVPFTSIRIGLDDQDVDERVEFMTTDCPFEDSERFKREIMASAFTMLDNTPSMLTFVTSSPCVGVFSKHGKSSLRSVSTVLEGSFFHNHQHIGASFFHENILYLFDANKDQKVVQFAFNPASGTYVEEGEFSTEAFLTEMCGFHDPPPFVVKAAAQASQNDSSCILFDKTGKLLISPNATEDARLLAKGILAVLDIENFSYIESIFTWLDEPSPDKIYIFGSNRDVYEIHRDVSSDLSWSHGNYRVVPYESFPYR